MADAKSGAGTSASISRLSPPIPKRAVRRELQEPGALSSRHRHVSVNHQHLRAFHAIAVEGSVSRAARRLNVAQPTLSQQIKALESRHRAALFERRRPPLTLTPRGRELFTLTQRMFAASDEIDVFLGDGNGSALHAIRIGADSPIYAARLAQV